MFLVNMYSALIQLFASWEENIQTIKQMSPRSPNWKCSKYTCTHNILNGIERAWAGTDIVKCI